MGPETQAAVDAHVPVPYVPVSRVQMTFIHYSLIVYSVLTLKGSCGSICRISIVSVKKRLLTAFEYGMDSNKNWE